ncbi:MAG TPA: hypothetical protein VFC39_06090, partial [Acidobacteriaceae bacterium]|nr:hypothetical protein [Acidobacteriaceae bacterium]
MSRSLLCALLLALSGTACTQSTPAPAPATISPADAHFKDIYTSEATWQRAQRGDQTPDDERRGRVQSHLPKVDPATQQAKLDFWTG